MRGYREFVTRAATAEIETGVVMGENGAELRPSVMGGRLGGVRLGADRVEWLERRAATERRNVSDVIRNLIDDERERCDER